MTHPEKFIKHLAEWADTVVFTIGVKSGNASDKKHRLWNLWERYSPLMEAKRNFYR